VADGGSRVIDWDLAPVLDWLAREGRLLPDVVPLVDALGTRLLAVGAPLWRFTIGLQTIHPQLRAMGTVWRRDRPAYEQGRPHGIETSPAYIGSPLHELVTTGRPVRYRLDRLAAENHAVLHEVAAEGGRDYYALSVAVAHGRWPALTFSTDRVEGFAESDIVKFERLASHLGPVLESHLHYRVSTTLMETYLGRETGRRILDGLIRRGDGEAINAVLWFSDLRGFTALNERLPPTEMLELLNAYFETVGDALARHDGEILKFIGDGVMAIFPVIDAMFLPDITAGAYDAAREAHAEFAEINAGRAEAGRRAIRFGVGLHVGMVTFGNIGTRDRLDFTVIGPAVNRCSRMEGMTKALGVSTIASSEFKALCPRPLRPLGAHRLRGVERPVELHAPEWA
jgi:adenylate cyclase